MSDFLKRNLWSLEKGSDVDMELLMYVNDVQLHINIEDEEKSNEFYKLIKRREGLHIAINNNISFMVSTYNSDESDMNVYFYEDINWKLTKIEDGLFAILASKWIDEESILSALRSNLENPRLIDTSNISTKVQEVLEN